MKNNKNIVEEFIPMQVGAELRIGNDGSIIVDNPELELANQPRAADAVLAYHYDSSAKQHVLRLLDPVADHQHLKHHHPGD
jgi:hypothetical protein